MDVEGLESSSRVHCRNQDRSRLVGGTLCQDHHADKVSRGKVMMFVLGAYWAWNPPTTCFGAQSPSFKYIIVKLGEL